MAWFSLDASLSVHKDFLGTPLALVCSHCTYPFVGDSQPGRRWREAVTMGVNQEGEAVALAAAAPLRKCSVSGPVDIRGVPTGTCSVCYRRARKRSVSGSQTGSGGHYQDFKTVLRPDFRVAPTKLERKWLKPLDVVPLPWRASADGAGKASVAPATAALVTHRPGEKRPEEIKIKLFSGGTRTYTHDVTPRKDEVGPRQKRRRAALASAAVGQVLIIEPGFLTAAVRDLRRRANQRGGVAVAPVAVANVPLSVRMQNQFILDNNMSRTLWQRVRLLMGGRASGLASRELLRRDLRTAQAEARNLVMSDGQGAFLVTPRAAVRGLLDDLLAVGQFFERLLRGPDGEEIDAISEFVGQEKPGDLPDPSVHDVQLCFGLDKGGQLSSCKALLSILNQEKPCSRGNTLLYGVFPCEKDDHDAISRMADVYVPGIDELRKRGVVVSGARRAVRLILTGDYGFVNLWLGHKGASSPMPCLYCAAMRRCTARNGLLVDKYGDMQPGSKARGTLRTHREFEKMAESYRDCSNSSRGAPLTLKQHVSIVRRPLLIIDPSHISPMHLHFVLGITVWLLRLGIETVPSYNGLTRAQDYATDLASVLRHSVWVKPKPYFWGAFEGRQCQNIGRRLSMVSDLLAKTVPSWAGKAYTDA